MPNPPERLAIHAYVSEEAFYAWRDFADEAGMSVTSVVEAIGQVIRDDPEDWDRIAEALNLIKKGRRIDADRRRRGRS